MVGLLSAVVWGRPRPCLEGSCIRDGGGGLGGGGRRGLRPRAAEGGRPGHQLSGQARAKPRSPVFVPLRPADGLDEAACFTQHLSSNASLFWNTLQSHPDVTSPAVVKLTHKITRRKGVGTPFLKSQKALYCFPRKTDFGQKGLECLCVRVHARACLVYSL